MKRTSAFRTLTRTGFWPRRAIAIVLFVVAAARAGTIYFVDIFSPDLESGFIRRADPDVFGFDTLADVGGGLRGVAVDVAGGKIYWTDVNNFVIRRSNLDGTNPQDLITSGLEFPAVIAIDSATGKIYWGDQSAEELRRANLDGSDAEPFLPTPFHRGLAIDAANGKIYWTTSISATSGAIVRANLDGTGLEPVVTGAGKPAAIALDVAAGRIYGTDYVLNKVRRAGLDGANVQDLFAPFGDDDPRGISLDLANGKVYWGQDIEFEGGNAGQIMRMNLDGTGPEVLTTGLGLVQSLVFVPAAVTLASANPPMDNPFVAGQQPFRDVLQTGPAAALTQGIGGAGTPDEDAVSYGVISVTFSAAPSPAPSPANVGVSCTGGACPSVTSVTGAGAGPYSIGLSAPIPPAQCTTLTFAGTAQRLRYESLPGDVNLNGTSTGQDVLTLVAAINGGLAADPANRPRFDVNRNGLVTGQDVLRVVQLLNGTNSPQTFNGETVAACP